MFIDFMGVCFDEIFNQAAKFKYMFGGKAQTPVVIRTMVGAGFRAAAQHSQMLTPIFTHIPGLKVVCPSNAYDAKGLLTQSIRDDDPVIFCEHKNLYAHESDVPAEAYTIPFAEANVVREGKDATIVAYGLMVHKALEAADALAKEQVEAEVIELSPIDWDTVIESVENTGRLVVVDEAHPRCSIATDVAAYVGQNAFGALKAGAQMVTAPHTLCRSPRRLRISTFRAVGPSLRRCTGPWRAGRRPAPSARLREKTRGRDDREPHQTDRHAEMGPLHVEGHGHRMAGETRCQGEDR